MCGSDEKTSSWNRELLSWALPLVGLLQLLNTPFSLTPSLVITHSPHVSYGGRAHPSRTRYVRLFRLPHSWSHSLTRP